MAKKSASSAAPESKLGLILTLVFFILATFILGTLAYFGYAEQEKLVATAKDADKKRKDAEARLEEERARKLVLRTAVGTDAQEDQADLSALIGQRGYAVLDEYAKMTAKLKERLPDGEFDWALGQDQRAPEPKPKATFPDLVLKFKNDAVLALGKVKTSAAETKAAQDERDQATKRTTDDKKKFDEKVAELSKGNLDDKKDKSEGFTKLEQTNDDLSKQLEKLKRDKKNSEAELEKQLAQVREELNKKDNKLAAIESKRTPPEVDLNRPKGVIEKRQGNVVYLNIGSSQGLRPQTTFSIFSADRGGVLPSSARQSITIDPTGRISTGSDGKLSDTPPEMKGAIEVDEIIGASSAKARVTYEIDPIRNPIREKDTLFNPSWTPGMKEHIAIAGIIDLNGDGIDDNDEFIRMLERQGVVVDAYLDLKDRQIKGKGITLQTGYLILGPSPDLDGPIGAGGGEADPRSIVKKEVIAKMTEMRGLAKELGVQPMGARRFLSMIGFQLPKTVAPIDYAAGRYLRNPPAVAPMEPKKDGQ